jgi:hypothetical protein
MQESKRTIAAFEKSLSRLVIENEQLRREIEFLRGHPSIARGIKGETLIAQLLSAKRSMPGSGHDIATNGKGLLLEVKYSGLLSIMTDRPIKRWVWTKLFGELGQKKFDRLLLIGDIDYRFRDYYADPNSPYVMFDLPYDEAVDIARGILPGRRSRVELTTNPITVKSWRAKVLFEHHQVTPYELQQRYPNLESTHTQET